MSEKRCPLAFAGWLPRATSVWSPPETECLQQALECIHAPKGVTSIIAAVATGDFDPIQIPDAVGVSLQAASEQLMLATERQNNSQSDWAYWGYAGDIAYWRAVVNILRAAEITGPDNLPDVPPPDLENKVVMDACAEVERFGARVLREAHRQRESQPEGGE